MTGPIYDTNPTDRDVAYGKANWSPLISAAQTPVIHRFSGLYLNEHRTRALYTDLIGALVIRGSRSEIKTALQTLIGALSPSPQETIRFTKHWEEEKPYQLLYDYPEAALSALHLLDARTAVTEPNKAGDDNA